MRSSGADKDLERGKKQTLSQPEQKRKDRELLLTKNFNTLSQPEQIEYIKAYVFDFLQTAFKDYEKTEISQFTREYQKTLTRIEEASELTAIDTALNNFAYLLKNWKGAYFIESGLESYFKEIAKQIDHMTNILYNLKFYSDYGMIVHGAAHQKGALPTLTFTQLSNGLPREIRDKIMEDWRNISIVYVSGSGLNTYGHALLFLGKAGFVHIDRPYSFPKHMRIDEFNTYLAFYGKVLLGLQKIPLTNIKDFIVKLNELCKERWLWLGVKHNCLTFCHDAVTVGGYNPGEQEEFKSLAFKLPIDWLLKTRQEQLLGDVVSHKTTISEFNEDLLKTHDINAIPVLDFNPGDIVKFISYVIDNMDTIIRWQTELVSREPDKHGQSNMEIAARKIEYTLTDIINKMNNQYQILFSHIVDSPLFKELTSRIAPAIRDATQRINVENERLKDVHAKLLASGYEQSARIEQGEEESKSRHSTKKH